MMREVHSDADRERVPFESFEQDAAYFAPIQQDVIGPFQADALLTDISSDGFAGGEACGKAKLRRGLGGLLNQQRREQIAGLGNPSIAAPAAARCLRAR